MDDDKRRRLEAGKEMLESYKLKRSNKRLSKSLEQASDEESFSNEVENQSMDLRSIGNNESVLSRDITYSSVSMSEGEGDADIEGLTENVTVLKELLQGKEACIEALRTEFDHLGTDISSPTSSHSQNSNILNKDIEALHKQHEECMRAIDQRDILIEKLSSSLKKVADFKDNFCVQFSILNSTKLENSHGENTFDEKATEIDSLLENKTELKTNLSESNISVDETNQQAQYQCIEKVTKDINVVIHKFKAEIQEKDKKYQDEIKKMSIKHNEELEKLKEEHEIQRTTEKLKYQSQIMKNEQTIKSLKTDLITTNESNSKEKELLTEQIKLQNLQIAELTTKYVTACSVLDSKESIERSLDQTMNDSALLKAENESLKFKLNDLTNRYLDSENLLSNGQIQERNLSNKISNVENSSIRFSGISFSEMDETTYQTIDEQCFQQQLIKKKLEQNAPFEKDLIDKIEDYKKQITNLENVIKGYKKQIKDFKNTREQLTNKKNSNLEDEQKQRFSSDSLDVMRMSSYEFEEETSELKKTVEKRDKEVADFIKKLEEINEINKKIMEENNELKTGLASAYAECAVIDEMLDKTLGFGETKLNDSTLLLDQTGSSNTSYNLEDLLHKKSDYNKVLKKLDLCQKQFDEYERQKSSLLDEIDSKINEQKEIISSAKEKEEEYRKEINTLKKESTAECQRLKQLLLNCEEKEMKLQQTISEMKTKHTREMVELRKYFEEKCSQIEKDYSEEVLSFQSRKMSDNDSEIKELTEDLYVGGSNVNCLGGGGDALGVLNNEGKNDELLVCNSEHQKNSLEDKITAEYKESIRKQLQDYKDKSGRTALLKAVNQFCQTEQSSTVGGETNELNELRADYDRQLKEQVGLARIDIIDKLQEQIEALITMESESDENWPSELLELRNKFTSNAEKKLQTLKERHSQEIKRIKEGNNKIIYDLQEEMKRFKTESYESLQSNLIQERDILHKACMTLKNLVLQLVTYFNQCEEELNNTLISEVFKKQLLNRSDNNLLFDTEYSTKIKRVHFAPQSNEINSIIANDNKLHELINTEQDVERILKTELDACFERLKADNATILNASYSDSESWSTGPSDNPAEKLLNDYRIQNEHLKVKVIDLQQRLLLADSKKEVISEGYGVQDEPVCKESQEDFSELQDRAKHVVMNGSNDIGYLIQLIEELYKHADRSLEDTKKEKEDLQHQIEAADKQLRSMRKFQEEQAVEREAERDESAKQIQQLQERLREREREKDRDYRITSAESALSPASSSTGNSTLRQIDESEINVSVEALTTQFREAEAKRAEKEIELKNAVTKILELRNIIRDTDQQIQSKIENEEILNNKIEQLKEIIVLQTNNQEKLVQKLEVVESGHENNQLSDHIGHLQEQLRKHQLSSEQLTANSSALKQLRFEICEMQSQLDQKTREIESLHVYGSSLSLSQPSEDVSIRDQIEASRCLTPDDPSLPPVLPLDHMLKLKEIILKHFRAEDVALKRLKDLDNQFSMVKRQNDDLLAEQEILQQKISEQLFQNEMLRTRLEQQKQNAPFAQRQATSKLESQLYEMNKKLESTERNLEEKEMENREMKNQLERISRILAEKEKEIANFFHSENDAMQKLRDNLELVEEEKRVMKAKLSIQDNPQNLLQLFNSIFADKNVEIEFLKKQLYEREKQLDIYLSTDPTQIKELLQQQNEQKNSARTLSDIISIKSDCDVSEAIREAPNLMKLQNVSALKIPKVGAQQSASVQSKKDVVDFSQEIGDTPKVPRLNIESFSCSSEAITSNAAEISKGIESLQMYVRDKVSLARVSPTLETETESHEGSSEDPNNFVCHRHDKVNKNNSDTIHYDTMTIHRIHELEMYLDEIKSELNNKEAALKERDSELLEIKNNLAKLQENIECLNEDRQFYQVEYEAAKKNESKIQKDLEEVENVLKIKNEELEDFKEKIQINQRILIEETERYKHNEITLRQKITEIGNFKEIITEKDITIEKLQIRIAEAEKDLNDLQDYRRKLDASEKRIIEFKNEIERLSDDLNNRDQMIRKLEMARRNSLSRNSSPSEKDQEIYHLQEYIKEKDKLIREMNDDNKSVQRALEIIQNKMKESGNVVELRKKLKEEQKKNIELIEQIAKLQTEVEMLSTSRRAEEDNDITEKLRREVNRSVTLDQQLINVIDNEPDIVLQKNENLKQAKEEIDELNRFKDDLEIEREMLKSQITEYENRIMQLKSDTEEETMKIARLEEELSKEKHLVKSLQLQLHKEKDMSEEDKLKDIELISQLRIKLDEALEIKDKLIMEQKNMEVLNAVRDQNKDGLSDLQDQLKKEMIKLTNKLEIEQRKNEDLQGTLKKLNDEKNELQKQYEMDQSKIKKLTNTVDLTDLVKDQMKSNLQRAKEELKAKNEECIWQQSILKTMIDAENKRNQKRTNEHSKLKNPKGELMNTQEVRFDIEADMKSRIEFLTDKETELKEQLNAVKKENKKLTSLVAEKDNELKKMIRRDIDSTQDLMRERSPPNKNLQNLKSLNPTIERMSQDKVYLHQKIDRLREENEKYLNKIRVLEHQLTQKYRNMESAMIKNEIHERMQYFYGKYIRFESRVKSLIYQKRFLLIVLGSYEYFEINVLATLAQLTDDQRRISRGEGHHRYNPRIRFRAVVLAINATQRMKWLVLRWRTGLRVGANVILENMEPQTIGYPSRHRNVGSIERSPPVRDRNRDNGTSTFSNDPYLRRLNHIQQNLHLTVPERNINSFKSN